MTLRLLCGALAIAIAVGFSIPTQAAYATATIIGNEELPDGRYQLTVRFTGNAGEPAQTRVIYIDAGTTGTSLRQWAIQQAAGMNSARTLGRSGQLQIGQVVDLSAITPTPPTAKQVWLEKVSRYKRLQGPAYTGAAQTALAALLTDINSTYAAGFLDQ